jgi:hypothetical protein
LSGAPAGDLAAVGDAVAVAVGLRLAAVGDAVRHARRRAVVVGRAAGDLAAVGDAVVVAVGLRLADVRDAVRHARVGPYWSAAPPAISQRSGMPSLSQSACGWQTSGMPSGTHVVGP